MLYSASHYFIAVLVISASFLPGCSGQDKTTPPTPTPTPTPHPHTPPQPVSATSPTSSPTPPHPKSTIVNLIEVAPGLWSGSEPTGEPEYAQLESMGIRTVISVDAVAPNIELAKKHNIRVVHLPIGYDKVPDKRVFQITYAIATLEHPIYIHCHHGKHRGPAAAAAGAIAAGYITNAQGVEFMERAGTSPAYSGLWRSVQLVPRLNLEKLRDQTFPLPERQETSDFIKMMGQIDRLHDQLWDRADQGFATPEDHPDLTADAIAGQIQDLLRASATSKEIATEGVHIKLLLQDSIDATIRIEQALAQNDLDAARFALEDLSQSCLDCHTRFRD